jgi:predicted AAA+ superfamily ATPase
MELSASYYGKQACSKLLRDKHSSSLQASLSFLRAKSIISEIQAYHLWELSLKSLGARLFLFLIFGSYTFILRELSISSLGGKHFSLRAKQITAANKAFIIVPYHGGGRRK